MSKQVNDDQSYTILVPSEQGRTISIKAPSPEMAIQKLQGQIAGKQREDTDIASTLVWDAWSDPSEIGEEWLITPDTKDEENPAAVMSWNGNSLKTYRDLGTILKK